jgi:hypothetical protein
MEVMAFFEKDRVEMNPGLGRRIKPDRQLPAAPPGFF